MNDKIHSQSLKQYLNIKKDKSTLKFAKQSLCTGEYIRKVFNNLM